MSAFVLFCFFGALMAPHAFYTGRPVCSSPWGSGPASHKQGDICGEARGGDGSLCPQGNMTGQMLPFSQDTAPLGDLFVLANSVFSDCQQADGQTPKGHAAAAAAQNEEGGVCLARGTRPDAVLSRPRTDALLLRLSLVVGREVFYAALWGSVLASPSIRLPASLFVVGHINRGAPGREQKYMLGTDYQLTVGAPVLAGGGGRAGTTGSRGVPRDWAGEEAASLCGPREDAGL